MSDPTNMAEYIDQMNTNISMSGIGIEYEVHLPCPFCAHAGWLSYVVPTMRDTLMKGATCANCGRSARLVLQEAPNSVKLELVQTGGPDQPDWMTPQIPKVN